MTELKIKIALGLAAALALFALATGVSSHLRMRSLETTVTETKRSADEQKIRSDELEKQTFIYKEKAAYLESKLAEINAAAKQQDETLEKLSADTDAARRDLERSRRSPK